MSDKQKQPRQVTLGWLLSWGIGILCIILMAQSLIERPHHFKTIGFPYLVAVFVLLPPIRKLFLRFSNMTISAPTRVTIVIFLFSVAILKTLNTAPLSYNYTSAKFSAPITADDYIATNGGGHSFQSSNPSPDIRASAISGDVKNEVIKRCKMTLNQYGASLIKTCIDHDLMAYESLKTYPEEHRGIIKRCESSLFGHGWSLIKTCVDHDIQAEEAIKSY